MKNTVSLQLDVDRELMAKANYHRKRLNQKWADLITPTIEDFVKKQDQKEKSKK